MENVNIDLQAFLINAFLRIGGAVVILLVGRWLAGLARRSVHRILARAHATSSVSSVLERGACYGVLLFAVMFAFVALGVPGEVVVGAVIVVAIVAVVALRETLGDLAATVLFLVFQPFRVGDVIETNGVVGQVQEIMMFSTVLITMNYRRVIIPNGSIQNNLLVN
jgi:small conductance mechanosensitive channel